MNGTSPNSQSGGRCCPVAVAGSMYEVPGHRGYLTSPTGFGSDCQMKHWIHWLPGLDTFRRYEAAWLPHDIFAGVVLATMLVPVGIAYAAASGLPNIYGLYATIVPLLAYALFGPSRILVLGPDSALAGVILGVITPLSGGNPVRAA